MIPRYSGKKAKKIIARYDGWLRQLESRYGVPRACMQAMLYREITGMDWLDIPADLAVRIYWLRYRLRGRKTPRITRGVLGKKDSSTGYAQIFARVAICAARFAVDHGLATQKALGLPDDHPLSPDSPDDLCLVWHLLHRDPRLNLHLAALNLLSAAWEMNGSLDFDHFSPEDMQRVFTRYNANTRQITPYGRDTYQLYLEYSQSNHAENVSSSVSV